MKGKAAKLFLKTISCRPTYYLFYGQSMFVRILMVHNHKIFFPVFSINKFFIVPEDRITRFWIEMFNLVEIWEFYIFRR